MSDATSIEEASQAIYLAHLQHRQLDARLLEDCRPQTVEQCHRIQDRVIQLLDDGKAPGFRAWKTGASSLDEVPFAAPIPARYVAQSGARLRAAEHHMLGVEAELAFRFGRALPARDRAWEEDEVLDAVEEVIVAIEIIDTRFRDWEQAPDRWLLADNSMTGGLVLGGGTRGFRGIDYARQTARIRIDDTLACEATGSLPLVNPVPLVVFMSNHLAARTGGFRAGDVLTTGTWTGMVPARPGSRVHAVFPGIGEAALEFG